MTARGGSAAAILRYSENAATLADRYEAIPNEAYYAPVRHLIPVRPCRIVDIGTATGRDARWFAEMGHSVTAVEPVAAFLDAARKTDDRVVWLEDALPDLANLRVRAEVYDYINVAAVWQHLDLQERLRAADTLARLAALGGLLVMALRHGPTPPGMPVYPIDPDDTADLFRRTGFTEVFRAKAQSIQAPNRAAGVTWTWLALRRVGAEK